MNIISTFLNNAYFDRFIATAALIVASSFLSVPTLAVTLSADEQQFAQQINDYRVANGLAAVDVTVTLTDVAQAHVLDLFNHTPHLAPGCNLHSWSNNGAWTGGCYTPDHANAALMWDKPSEFSGGAYGSAGYELAASGYTSTAAALNGFKGSSSHNDVLLNQGIWSSLQFNSMGVGVQGGFYAIWFGTQIDPQGVVGLSPVPLPGAVWLFSAALIGLFRIGRRRPTSSP